MTYTYVDKFTITDAINAQNVTHELCIVMFDLHIYDG